MTVGLVLYGVGVGRQSRPTPTPFLRHETVIPNETKWNEESLLSVITTLCKKIGVGIRNDEANYQSRLILLVSVNQRIHSKPLIFFIKSEKKLIFRVYVFLKSCLWYLNTGLERADEIRIQYRDEK